MADLNWQSMHQDAMTTLEGEFPVVIVEARAAKTNDQSKDMVKFKAKIEAGHYVGRPLWGQFTISPESPGAMRMLFSHWAVLGLNAAFFAQNPTATVEFIAQSLVGRRAVAVVGTRTWQGTEREEIQQWKPADSVGGLTGAAEPLQAPLPGALPGTPSPATPLATGGQVNPTARMTSIAEPGAVAIEPAVAENREAPPELPF